MCRWVEVPGAGAGRGAGRARLFAPELRAGVGLRDRVWNLGWGPRETPPSTPPPLLRAPTGTRRGAPARGPRDPEGVSGGPWQWPRHGPPPDQPDDSLPALPRSPSRRPASSGRADLPARLPRERTMRGPGRPLLLGLLLVLGAAGPGRGVSEPREAADRQTLLRLIAEIIQELRKYHSGESKRLQPPGPQDAAPGRGEASDYGLDPEEQRAEIVPRDLRMKDKFLKHLTGPLYFSPKCSKHFHRLYHNTRDCTVPAYYKRCARLLTRLAVSPMCMDG